MLCLGGCQNKRDCVEIWNKDKLVFDDIIIDVKEGYFYKEHKKFTVDESTIGVTIYFLNSEEDTWDNKVD